MVSPSVQYGSTLEYNGIRFPNQSKCSLSLVPLTDDAGRVTKSVRYQFRVETYFHNLQENIFDGSTDITSLDATGSTGMTEIRRKLSDQGKNFKFSGKGIASEFDINSSAENDISYGPKVDVIQLEFVGDSELIKCVWQCTIELSCNGSQGRPIVEMTYDANWAINHGYTVRSINATIVVAALANNDSAKVTETADDYRDQFKVTIPTKFQRTVNSYRLSRDKRTLNISIVDEEIRSDRPYSQGIVNPQIRYNISTRGQSFNMWSGTVSGSVEVANGYPMWFGWLAIQDVIARKRAIAKSKGKGFIPKSFSFTEEVFGRGFSCNISWWLSAPLDSIFDASGLFNADSDTNWEDYRRSMSVPWSSRGYTGMTHQVSDDAIVSQCNKQKITVTGKSNPNRLGNTLTGGAQFSECPPPNESWIQFQLKTRIVRSDNGVFLDPVQHSPEWNASEFDPTKTKAELPKETNPTYQPVQVRQTPTAYILVVTGNAVRAGYEIPPFSIKKWEGIKVLPVGDFEWEHTQIADLGCPIYAAKWVQYYRFTKPPIKLYEEQNKTKELPR
jgi:hypothetical protein